MKHVQQKGNSCGLACLAMLQGTTLSETASRLKLAEADYSNGMSLFAMLKHLYSLGKRPILYSALTQFLRPNTAYILVVPSLNTQGAQHFIIALTGETAAIVQVMDPMLGIVGKKAYTIFNLVQFNGIVDCGEYIL